MLKLNQVVTNSLGFGSLIGGKWESWRHVLQLRLPFFSLQVV